MIRPDVPERPEFVSIRCRHELQPIPMHTVSGSFAVARWNALWESAQFRRRFFHDGTDSDNRLPADPARIVEIGDRNIVFIPRTETRDYDYAPPSTCSPARLSTDSGCQCCAAGSGRSGRS